MRVAHRSIARAAAVARRGVTQGQPGPGSSCPAALAKSIAKPGAGGLVRTNVGIFGSTNAGKSTLMNVLMQGETSIVSDVPGTTADPKVATGEIHALGACKFFDTPGIDEDSKLGDLKRAKARDVLKRADASLVVVSLHDAAHSLAAARDMIERAGKLCQQPKSLLIINTRSRDASTDRPGALNTAVEAVERELGLINSDGTRCGDAPPSLVVDLHTADANARVSAFLAANLHGYRAPVELLPPLELGPRSTVLLNAPMDKETPHGRLLRPQSWTQEALLRRFTSSFVYRMDLGRGRSPDPEARRDEEARFRDVLTRLRGANGRDLDLMITDSQAMDLVHPWTLDEEGKPLVALTTFSVLMVNYMSGGRLPEFVKGLRVVRDMVESGRGGRVLICEACNHDRIIDDIGTDQVRAWSHATPASPASRSLLLCRSPDSQVPAAPHGRQGAHRVVLRPRVRFAGPGRL